MSINELAFKEWYRDLTGRQRQGTRTEMLLEAFEAGYSYRTARVAQPAPVRPDRPSVVGAKPVCLDCNKVGMLNCSHFDECDGQWVYKPDEPAPVRHDAPTYTPIEKCSACGCNIFVRENGRIVAHYDPEGNRCWASEKPFGNAGPATAPATSAEPQKSCNQEYYDQIMGRAALRQPGTPAEEKKL